MASDAGGDTAPTDSDASTVNVTIELVGHLVALSISDKDKTTDFAIEPATAKRLGHALLDAAAFAKINLSTRLQ